MTETTNDAAKREPIEDGSSPSGSRNCYPICDLCGRPQAESNPACPQHRMWDFEYEAKRNDAILQAVLKRLRFLDGYTNKCETHHGVRLAVSLIRSDINRQRQLIRKDRTVVIG